jgi:hypothetical protein
MGLDIRVNWRPFAVDLVVSAAFFHLPSSLIVLRLSSAFRPQISAPRFPDACFQPPRTVPWFRTPASDFCFAKPRFGLSQFCFSRLSI